MNDMEVNNKTFNNIYNNTEMELEIQVSIVTEYVILGILGLLGIINILCTILLVKQRQPKISDKLYLNMLIANMIFITAKAVIIILVKVLPYHGIQNPSTGMNFLIPMCICQIILATTVYGYSATILVTGWSIYVAVTTPLQFRIKFTSYRIRVYSAGIWIISLVVGVASSGDVIYEYIKGSSVYVKSKQLDKIGLITSVILLLGNVIISVIMGYFMWMIYKTGRQQPEQPDNDIHLHNNSQRRRHVKMFIILVILLTINILAALSRGILEMLTVFDLIESQAYPEIIIMFYLISPVVYVIKSPEQKVVLGHWFNCCFKLRNERCGSAKTSQLYAIPSVDSDATASINVKNTKAHVLYESAL